MASLLMCSSGVGSVLFDSLMEMAGGVAEVRETFRLDCKNDFENERSKLQYRRRGPPTPI